MRSHLFGKREFSQSQKPVTAFSDSTLTSANQQLSFVPSIFREEFLHPATMISLVTYWTVMTSSVIVKQLLYRRLDVNSMNADKHVPPRFLSSWTTWSITSRLNGMTS